MVCSWALVRDPVGMTVPWFNTSIKFADISNITMVPVSTTMVNLVYSNSSGWSFSAFYTGDYTVGFSSLTLDSKTFSLENAKLGKAYIHMRQLDGTTKPYTSNALYRKDTLIDDGRST